MRNGSGLSSVLSALTDADLVERYRSGDSRAGGELVQRHNGMLRAVAWHYGHGSPDVYGAAVAGFLTALRSFDASRGNLSPYAARACARACKEELRVAHAMPLPTKLNDLVVASRSGTVAHDRQHSERCVARGIATRRRPLSLDCEDACGHPLSDSIACDGDPETSFEEAEHEYARHEELRAALSGMPERDRRAALASTELGGLSRLAEEWGVSRSRTQQIAVRALERLRARMAGMVDR